MSNLSGLPSLTKKQIEGYVAIFTNVAFRDKPTEQKAYDTLLKEAFARGGQDTRYAAQELIDELKMEHRRNILSTGDFKRMRENITNTVLA
ncbi:hypothetical protein M408DRAFT_327565 [Serendipita vermifera MAFF 305830]|uniref:Uncharacterized protein n=1 Tax=Serendipita vermifera MAFF 305830 TaxID=933852 RepID=A0A0C3BGM3_SERVB|nr:hypothetical protein M408DRAFT_327565 [Serendipita vermifera MAFF 305830]